MELERLQALALDRSVETLDPSIGPGVMGSCAGVADPQRRATLVECTLVPRPVVGEHPAHPDPVAIEECHDAHDELGGVRVALARAQFRVWCLA